MLLWIGFAVLAGGVIVALSRPFMRSASSVVDAGTADVAVYRDQIGALEAERDRGLLETSEAEAARAELARRLLRAAENSGAAGATAGGNVLAGRLAFVLAALIPMAGVAVYLGVGSPQLPGQPHAERLQASSATRSVEELVGLVEARLRQHPEDVQGWDVIAPVYARANRFRDAAVAYRNAIRLAGETPKRLIGLAEALILAEDGLVGSEARQVVERLRALEPGRAEVKFWTAMAKEQDGDVKGAIGELEALLASAAAEVSWRPAVEARIAELRTRLGEKPAADAAATARQGAPGAGPSQQDVEAAARMTPAEQAAMVERMVEGLAARLAKDGRDAEGWAKLVRAYKVMGQDAKAREALDKARTSLSGDAGALRSIEELGQALGLGS